MLEVDHLELVGPSLLVVVMLKQVLWHSVHILVGLLLLASVALLSSIEVVVATLAAFPSTWWEFAILFLLLSLNLVRHWMFASVAISSALEIVVKAFVAVPATYWELILILALVFL